MPAWQSSTASQVSVPVQTSLSSQRLSVGTLATPVTGSQLSMVQLTPSSGIERVPAWQPVTASQVSRPLQTSASSAGQSGVVPDLARPVHGVAGLGAGADIASSQRLSVGTLATPVTGSQVSVQADAVIEDRSGVGACR